jgi:hypothetical protein
VIGETTERLDGVVRFMRSSDHGQTWARTDVDSAFAIGWNTAIHVVRSAESRTDIFLSHWFKRNVISCQVRDEDTGVRVLRVARLHLAA